MIDLHIHTTFSDGTKTVVDTLKEANNARLSLISVTDHNVIDAYTMLNQKVTREEFDGKIITGVELTTSLDNEIVEILGYGFDVDRMKENMTGNILTFKEYKIKEYELTIETYRNRGIKIDENNIKFSPDRESCREQILKECARYPENIERLLDKGSLESVGRFSRNEFYNPESDFFVNLSVHYPSFQETIDMIHIAKQITPDDYENFDYIICMEEYNIRNMQHIIGRDSQNKVHRLLDFTPTPKDVDDPWYHHNFDKTYEEILLGCQYLLSILKQQIQ